MTGEQQLPLAGWYSDPEQPQTQRYWDGMRWTDQRAPLASQSEGRGAGVLLVVSYVAAFLFPIVGVIFAIVLLVRRQIGHGVAVMLISIAVAVAGYFLVLDETEDGRRDSANRIERQVDCLERNDFRLSACRNINRLE